MLDEYIIFTAFINPYLSALRTLGYNQGVNLNKISLYARDFASQ